MKVEILGLSTQKDFENKISKIGAENITELCILHCVSFSEIPYLPNLKKLNCANTNIKSIPLMEKLEILYCNGCSLLDSIPCFSNLKVLSCSHAYVSIGLMKKLKKLTYSFCTDLYKIPYLPNLKILGCERGDIRSIPLMKKLEKLWVSNCPNLCEIPCFPNLKKLHYSRTNIKYIPPMEKLEELWIFDCPKLYEISHFPNLKKICHHNMIMKIKFYNKELKIYDKQNTLQHFQGRLYQNTYRTYELLIF